MYSTNILNVDVLIIIIIINHHCPHNNLVIICYSICMVSSVTKEGIKDLQERIHSAALNAKDPDTHEHVIGMQVGVVMTCTMFIKTMVHVYMYVKGGWSL